MSAFQSSPALAGRALQRRIGDDDWRGQGFNPRPPLRDGRSGQQTMEQFAATGFNPRPPLRDGRSLSPVGDPVNHLRFNPRPPLRDGRSRGHG